MGYRELLLTLGAITIFGLTMLGVNEHMISGTEAIYDQQAEYLAMNIAQKYIEEAKTKAFDEKTINKESSITQSSFTQNIFLGPDTGENYPNNFDDVDDYDGLAVTDTSTIIAMDVAVAVTYVQAANLTAPVATREYYKLMNVEVSNSYLQSPVRAVYVFSYQKN